MFTRCVQRIARFLVGLLGSISRCLCSHHSGLQPVDLGIAAQRRQAFGHVQTVRLGAAEVDLLPLHRNDARRGRDPIPAIAGFDARSIGLPASRTGSCFGGAQPIAEGLQLDVIGGAQHVARPVIDRRPVVLDMTVTAFGLAGAGDGTLMMTQVPRVLDPAIVEPGGEFEMQPLLPRRVGDLQHVHQRLGIDGRHPMGAT